MYAGLSSTSKDKVSFLLESSDIGSTETTATSFSSLPVLLNSVYSVVVFGFSVGSVRLIVLNSSGSLVNDTKSVECLESEIGAVKSLESLASEVVMASIGFAELSFDAVREVEASAPVEWFAVFLRKAKKICGIKGEETRWYSLEEILLLLHPME